MFKKNIVLVGFMGSGKSLVSKEISRRLKKEVISTDDLIEKREGKSIADIFRDSKETYFRKLEKEVVKEVAAKQGVIIDCGGGVVLDEENIKTLKENGILFYLKASAECLYQQIQLGKPRPLLQVPDPLGKVKELLKQRENYYSKADHTIDCDFTTVDDMANKILRKLEQ